MSASASPTLTAVPGDTRTTRFPLDPVTRVIGIGLSVGIWLLVLGPENGAAGVPAALLAVTMTAPLLFVRRRPVTAALVIAGAAVLNGLAFPDLVRCAAAFPAALVVAFAVGAWARSGGRGRGASLLGLAGVLGSLVAQWAADPALQDGYDFLWFGPGLALLAWAGGLGVAALRRRRAGR